MDKVSIIDFYQWWWANALRMNPFIRLGGEEKIQISTLIEKQQEIVKKIDDLQENIDDFNDLAKKVFEQMQSER